MTQPPHELAFVLDVPETGRVRSDEGLDVYLPGDGPLPAVVIVPGPSPEAYPVRPRQWPLFTGYARLLTSRGVVAAVADLPYHNVTGWSEVSELLPDLVESVRALPEVDADRIAVWAFSGGGLLVSRWWFAESPSWLRCLALTYPMLGGETTGLLSPGRPVVLTRVGLESPNLQEEVDRFVAKGVSTGTSVHVIDVPEGHHGFDVADHTDESRAAVLAAVDFVVGHLVPAR
ncbi:dienelactone hydrolase family protein [Actinophytocola oryzae]|uniref:Dienelactone hydrolase n=1 Tax=Actinophytocola oryzae TaxID=502181 RepID=A0A4R7VVZ1_9PSEU|nr:alpha/beta hydrolase [Actinophytocola oryzae]TDV53639.1 dienelactone hydrolase [Actinophytocola oryzae]